MSGSETSASYRLLLNNSATGITVAGTGSAISFGNQTPTPVGSYTYTVEAVSQAGTLCATTVMMTGNVAVALLPLTTVSINAASQVICETGTVSVTGTASTAATQAVTYQWYKDGVSLGSAQQTSILSLTSVVPTQSGNYSLVATGTCNSATSSAFSLTVNPQPNVTLIFGGATHTINDARFPTITLTRPLDPQNLGVFYVQGGVMYERLYMMDRVNGYQILQTQINNTGIFVLDIVGPYKLTVTNEYGCSRTVQGLIVVRQ